MENSLVVKNLRARREEVMAEARAVQGTAESFGRDMSGGEQRRFGELTAEVDAIDARLTKLKESADRDKQAADAFASLGGNPSRSLGQHPLLVSTEHLRQHAEAIASGMPFGAREEFRATVTASGDLSSPGSWATGAGAGPRDLAHWGGVKIAQLDGVSASMPTYTIPAGAAGVNETTAHTEIDAAAPLTLTVTRSGAWSKVSAAVGAFDSLEGLNYMHARKRARDLDLKVVTSIVTAASTATAFIADVDRNVRIALARVSDVAAVDNSDLVVVGTPADVAALQDQSPSNGEDVGSFATRFAGARLYATAQGTTAGTVTVFHPGSFRIFLTSVQSASHVDPADGSNVFGSWLHASTVGQEYVGTAVAVEVVDPG